MEFQGSDLSQQMSIFNSLMQSLIYEKKTMTNDKKMLKEKALCELAREKMVIVGDDEFKSKIFGFLDNIISVKPGRKLIKTLCTFEKQIPITSGKEWRLRESFGFKITVPHNTDEGKDYNSFNNQSFSKPVWINLAHELIHALHLKRHGASHYDSDRMNMKNIICHMHNSEEMITIAGEKDPKCKLDVLCENAFLLALGLPPRIDHEDCEHEIQNNPEEKVTIDSYCIWLDNALNSIKQIPEHITNDKSKIRNFLYDNPMAVSSLTAKLRDDEQFMFNLVGMNLSLLDYLPDFRKNEGFMFKLCKANSQAFDYLDPKIFCTKNSTVELFHFMKSKNYSDIYIKEFYECLDNNLKNDLEIQNFIKE